MKFYSSFPFIEHITASYPDHLGSMMLVYQANGCERDYLVDEVKGCFSTCAIKQFYIGRGDGQKAMEELLAYDLFTEKSLIIVNEIEQWKKEELYAFAENLKKVSTGSSIWVLLVGSDEKGHKDFYTNYHDVCVALDLTREKPWDRDKRLLAWSMKEPTKYGKSFSSVVAQKILERAKGDFSFVASEVKRLCSSVGERGLITLDDLHKWGSRLASELSWDFAQKLVCEDAMGASHVFSKSTISSSFITQVRYFLHIGLALSSETSDAADNSVLTSINKFSDQKKRLFTNVANKRGKAFFVQALKRLAEAEASIRKGSKEKEELETFCIHLEKEKLHGRA